MAPVLYQKLLNKTMRIAVHLECVECKSRNYRTTKNPKVHPERVERLKYCTKCKKRTMHRETK